MCNERCVFTWESYRANPAEKSHDGCVCNNCVEIAKTFSEYCGEGKKKR